VTSSHAGKVVLDLVIESLMKFEDNMHALEVSHVIDDFAKLVDVLIDGFQPLKISCSLKACASHLDLVLQTEFCDELHHKFGPRPVRQTPNCLESVHLLVNELCHAICFHEGEGPHDLCMLVGELRGGKCLVQLSGVQKGPSFCVIASEIIRGSWFEVACL
jgi:hypothetical protein